MASAASGMRRRGGAGPTNDEDNEGSRVSSPAPKRDDRGPETSYEDSENGHKIAFDPRDISESAERNKQPKLTLMEEVLLMGLKDKQVFLLLLAIAMRHEIELTCVTGLPFLLERQHLICAPWLHSHRACFPRPHLHAEGCFKKTIPATGPRDRGHRRHIDRRSAAR